MSRKSKSNPHSPSFPPFITIEVHLPEKCANNPFFHTPICKEELAALLVSWLCGEEVWTLRERVRAREDADFQLQMGLPPRDLRSARHGRTEKKPQVAPETPGGERAKEIAAPAEKSSPANPTPAIGQKGGTLNEPAKSEGSGPQVAKETPLPPTGMPAKKSSIAGDTSI